MAGASYCIVEMFSLHVGSRSSSFSLDTSDKHTKTHRFGLAHILTTVHALLSLYYIL